MVQQTIYREAELTLVDIQMDLTEFTAHTTGRLITDPLEVNQLVTVRFVVKANVPGMGYVGIPNSPCIVTVTRPDLSTFNLPQQLSKSIAQGIAGEVLWADAFTIDQAGTWTLTGIGGEVIQGEYRFLGC